MRSGSPPLYESMSMVVSVVKEVSAQYRTPTGIWMRMGEGRKMIPSDDDGICSPNLSRTTS